MAYDKQNRNFNLDDFRRYENGSMSFEEQHLLEKRMLEDPFLAEAFEGFHLSGSSKLNIPEIDKEMNGRILSRVQDKKRNPVPLWVYPVAATIVIGFAIGWLVYLNQESLPESQMKSQELSSIVKPKPQIMSCDKSSPIADTGKIGPGTISLAETNKHVANSESKPAPIKTLEEVASLDAIKEDSDKSNVTKGESVAILNEAAVANAPAPSAVFSAPAQVQAKNYILARDSTPGDLMVNGRLVDSNDRPIAGATILSSKTAGIQTDADGRFTIEAKIGDSLSASFIGYKTKNIKTEKADLGTIKLEEDMQALSEVVVTGYGSQNKNSLNARKESSDTVEPEPSIGWPAYNEYLKKMTLVSEIKGTVKISFTVDGTGALSEFKTTGKEELFERAIKVIREGATWRLGTNGKVLTSKVVTITLKFK